MAKAEPWLSRQTDSFAEAFPNVEAIAFTINDNPWGYYTTHGQRSLVFTTASARSMIPCPNQRCRRGGFDFGAFLQNYSYKGEGTVEVAERFPCGGDEGTPAGRKRGDSCMNSFKVVGTITFRG